MNHRTTPRRLRRGELARRRRFLAGAIAAGLLIAGSAFQLSRTPLATPNDVAPSLSNAPVPLVTEPVAAPEALAAARPNYSYSVIAGGAPTPELLREAAERDPVVRTHYAHFNLSKVRVVRLREARAAHVSYRMGDAVYWTRQPVVLKAGELLLTDGAYYARTRCGNQVADVAGLTTDAEPSPGVLDEPLPPIKPFGLSSFFAPFGATAGSSPGLAFAKSSRPGVELLSDDIAPGALRSPLMVTTQRPSATARASLPRTGDPGALSFDDAQGASVLDGGTSVVDGLAVILHAAAADANDEAKRPTDNGEVTADSEEDSARPVSLPVPEPATMFLIGSGLAAAAFRGWRARAQR